MMVCVGGLCVRRVIRLVRVRMAWNLVRGAQICRLSGGGGGEIWALQVLGLRRMFRPGRRIGVAAALYQSRFLSDSGRLFFDSRDGFVPKDVNGQEDVYEFEPEGVPESAPESARCRPAAASGSEVFKPERSAEVEGRSVEEGAGCVGLISSGASAQESAFLDASETGGDVFFLTTAKLAAQDFDDAYDVYDAQECTTLAPCLPAPTAAPPACATEASCKPAPSPQPSLYGLPASATFSSAGNLVSPPPPGKPAVKQKTVKCKKGFVKNRKGKCVRKKSKKRAKRASNDRRVSR